MNTGRHANLLRDFEGNGVHYVSGRDFDRLREAAVQAGLACFRIDLAGVTGRDDFLKRFVMSLDFPDWFGQNWDALADCLADLSWIEAEGYLLLLMNADAFWAACPGDVATALQIFTAVSESWREAGIPFRIFIDLRHDSSGGSSGT